MLIGETLAQCQHLLRGAFPYGCRRGHDHADARLHGQAVPGFTHAEAIDLAAAQRIDQQRRRQHHQPDVVIRVDAAGDEPVAQLVVVARERKHHRQRQLGLASRGARLEHAAQHPGATGSVHVLGSTCSLHLLPQRPGERDGIAAKPEGDGSDQRSIELARAHILRHEHGTQNMCGVKMTDGQTVADVGPGRFANQPQVQAMTRPNAALARRHQQRTIQQWHEADGDGRAGAAHFSNPAAVITLCATCTMRRFASIAALRSSS